MEKQSNKLSRVLIFTYATPGELDVKRLKEENEKHIHDLYSNLDNTSKISKLFRRTTTPDTDVIFLETGIGKLNSYRMLDTVLRETYEHCVPNIMIRVLNLGTAGSGLEKIGSLITCGRFIDIDMATSDWGQYMNNSDWCNQTYRYMPDGTESDASMMYSCNSSDKLITNMDDSFQRRDGWKVVCDTEGFSQARCCEDWSKLFEGQIRFSSQKYITNNFDENALTDREKALPEACEALTKVASRQLYNFYYAKN